MPAAVTHVATATDMQKNKLSISASQQMKL
jgi:hypothetical protein